MIKVCRQKYTLEYEGFARIIRYQTASKESKGLLPYYVMARRGILKILVDEVENVKLNDIELVIFDVLMRENVNLYDDFFVSAKEIKNVNPYVKIIFEVISIKYDDIDIYEHKITKSFEPEI